MPARGPPSVRAYRPAPAVAAAPCEPAVQARAWLRASARPCGLLAGLRAARLLHVDAAAEVRAFGNRHARGGDVAVDRPVVPDIDLVARGDVAGHFAEDDDRLREHLRLDLAVGADRQHVLAKLDLALDLSLDGQIFAAVELALDDDGFTYVHSSFLLSTLRVAGDRRTRRRCRLGGMRRGCRLRRGWPGAGRCSRLDRFIPFPHWAFSTLPKCWSFRGLAAGSR